MYPVPDHSPSGEYHDILSQMTSALLWVVRFTRPDLSYAVSLVALFSSTSSLVLYP